MQQSPVTAHGASPLASGGGSCGARRSEERYEFVRLIGRGAHSTVFLATDTRTQQLVALKRIRKRDSQGAVPGEYAIHKQLASCPSVTKMLDW